MIDVDGQWMEDVLIEVLTSDTQVPLGETEIAPGDPKIKQALQEVILPRAEELHPDEIRQHPMGDLAIRFGPPREDGLLIQTYIVSQHANLMDARGGTIVDGGEYGLDGLCAIGQGASQNKGSLAAAFAAVKTLSTLRKPVWLTVNTEGRSSHGGSIRLLDELDIRAAHGVLAFGTDLRISLGNRGRADIFITILGESSHSSQPWLGSNPIEGAADVVGALRSLPVPDPHPELGRVSVTPYQLQCFPVAPHTIPERARIVVDRRLLPEESTEDVVEAIRAHLAASSIKDLEIEAGACMLPAAVETDAQIVRALQGGSRAASGRAAETFWSLNAFDAGYACSKGIPTPMFGPGKRKFAGKSLVGSDAVSIKDCLVAAAILAHAARELCS